MRPLPVAVLAIAVASPAARAHHVVSEAGVTFPEPASRVDLSLQAARFRLPEGSGYYASSALAAEYAVLPWLSIQGRLPFHRLWPHGAAPVSGVGDVDLALKLRLFSAEHGQLVIAGGAGVELPTGDEDKGIGGGHVELSPFLLGAGAIGDFIAFTVLADRIALADEHHQTGEHVNFVSPHSEHELAYRVGVARAFSRLNLMLSLDGATLLVASRRGETLLSASARAGLLATDRVLVTLELQVPLTSARRIDREGTLAVGYRF